MLKPLILLITLAICSGAAARDIRYPNAMGLGESALGFAVLKLALSKTSDDFQLVLEPRLASAKRILMMLEQGEIDVVDGGFSIRTMTRFEPIYKPLDMGLTGWRLLIIHRDNAEAFAKVNTLDELKAFTLGQGDSWFDTDILKHAGFRVMTNGQLMNLLHMARMKRFEALPLEAQGVYRFIDRLSGDSKQLMVEPRLALIYPFGRFFSVRHEDKQLKHAIEEGMDKALADGSLLALLKSHPLSRDAFERADLAHRIQLHIENPNLTDGFKAIDPKWWYRPD
ncbi:hypothetical protein JYB87_01125 [Shewanella avicenniae]|uniref:Amino acid ABC transporter substrate-binding protein, PAAT family n=1 Tax=Shewanella avicenniae TaxID=2814294 RepID=A0ABX7QQZ0_9GAMM|nr:hypothetical protein [Shewanella avicenniae]QSX33887.1 hypothetical protein JYB87_01125 [Shewanella avicenniae]